MEKLGNKNQQMLLFELDLSILGSWFSFVYHQVNVVVYTTSI